MIIEGRFATTDLLSACPKLLTRSRNTDHRDKLVRLQINDQSLRQVIEILEVDLHSRRNGRTH